MLLGYQSYFQVIFTLLILQKNVIKLQFLEENCNFCMRFLKVITKIQNGLFLAVLYNIVLSLFLAYVMWILVLLTLRNLPLWKNKL